MIEDVEEVKENEEVPEVNPHHLLQTIDRRLKEIPYSKAITILQSLKKMNAPLDKARSIVDLSSCIVHSINVFWEGIDINKEKLTIDGDSLLMIYIYATIKAGCNDLFAQIKFINDFSTPYVKSTKLGYCATTLEVAINHILMLTKEELFPSS
jgi:Vacuolar sorting protein 9 (VPS9) domain